MEYTEIYGNLITLAKEGKFDVIVHGCNCFCRMKRGLAPQMAEAFDCDTFTLEDQLQVGDINKLGQIDYKYCTMYANKLAVVNAYTQYHWSTETKPFDYDAFKIILKKLNHLFKGKHIGLPQIGSHLAGGEWSTIKYLIQELLTDCTVTIVIFK